MEPLVFQYAPEPEPQPPVGVGVSTGHLVFWSGERGPALSTPCAMLIDDEGGGSVVLTGETQHVTVV